ncbi:MAG: dihydrofolate reductase [Paramuribaculum sp.]|nr:dihydrofolate reductase [Paramuribaculum sp.]
MSDPNIKITIIVAATSDGAIGRGGDMPFRLSSDLKRFKAITLGHPIVMGRKTFESLPGVLPGRTNIVVTRNPDYDRPGIITASDLPAALKLAAKSEGAGNIMIIRGGQIYRESLPLADRIELTEVDAEYPDADTFFPEINKKHWSVKKVSEWQTDTSSGLRFRYITLDVDTNKN